jgi:hypothetical protein
MDSKIKHMLKLIEEVKEIGREIGHDNILYNEQYKEIEISLVLGHTFNEGQGEDANNSKNEKCEYKTMLGEKGSFQYHWISKSKLDKLKETPHHYFVIYDKETNKLDKIYYLHINKLISDFEKVFLKSESKRILLNENSNSKKNKNTDAHKSYSLNKIKSIGAVLVYESKK